MKSILLKGGRKEVKPFSTCLAKAIEATFELYNEGGTRSISSGEARRNTHKEIFTERRLKISLANVNRREVIVAGGGDSQDETQGGNLSNGREDTSEVNTIFLSIAVSNQTTFEFGDATVGVALDCEKQVTAHDIGSWRNISKTMKFKGTNSKKTSELRLNCLAPI